MFAGKYKQLYTPVLHCNTAVVTTYRQNINLGQLCHDKLNILCCQGKKQKHHFDFSTKMHFKCVHINMTLDAHGSRRKSEKYVATCAGLPDTPDTLLSRAKMECLLTI